MTDDLTEVEGLTTAILVTLGENDVKTMEDLAGCATDDLIGWYEQVDGERTYMPGIFANYDIDAEGANEMIIAARLKAGWVTEEDLKEPEPKQNEESEVEALDSDQAPTTS